MENLALAPTNLYTCQEIKAYNTSDTVFIKPLEIRQYLFLLSPTLQEHCYRGVTSIGKLDLCWRSKMGERGHLQTSPLQRIAPGYGDIRLTVKQIPKKVEHNKSFDVAIKIHNCSDRSLNLIFNWDCTTQSSFKCNTPNGTNLETLSPNSPVEFTLRLIPLSLGTQYISGIRLTDSLLKRTHEHDDVCQVYVYPSEHE